MSLSSSLVELPGRGVTRVWEHPGPPGAPTLMLVHGVTLTAALNWSGVLEPLGAAFRVVAMDLCGHGESFRPAGRFSLGTARMTLLCWPGFGGWSSWLRSDTRWAA